MTTRTRFLHMVYFWMKSGGGNLEAGALAEGARRHLAGIPGVLRLEVGFPAGTARDVVDNSYGVGLLVEFGSGADHELYQEHPDHLQFIAECGALWDRVRVYDISL